MANSDRYEEFCCSSSGHHLRNFAIVKEHSFLYAMHVKGVAKAGLGVLQVLYSG